MWLPLPSLCIGCDGILQDPVTFSPQRYMAVGWLVFYVFLNIFRILVKQIWRQPSGFNNLWRDSTESSHTPPPEFGHSQVVSTMCDALSLQWVQICIPETRTVLVMIKLVSPPPSATQGQIHRGALSWTIPRVCPRHHLEIQPGASAPDTRRDSSCRTGACDLLQKAGSSSEARLRDVEGCKNLAICKSVFFTVKPMLTILVWQWALISVMNSQTEEHWLDYKLNSSQDFSNIYRVFNLNTMETNICQDWSLVFVDESGGAFRLKSCWKADRLDSLCLYFQYHGSV